VSVSEESPVPGLAALPRERLPQRDLWAGIESRIQPAKVAVPRRATRWPYALAASVCTAMIAGTLLRQPVETPAAAPAETPVAAPFETAALQSTASPRYGNSEVRPRSSVAERSLRPLRSEANDSATALLAQRAEAGGLMRANYSSDRGSHSQEALLRANLKLVAQAEREVRRALREEPESEALLSLLAAAENRRTELASLLLHAPD